MRLVDADALMDTLRTDFTEEENDHQFIADEWWWAATVRKTIENAPTVDAVRVVRCWECKYYREGDPEHPDCGYCKRLICGTVAPDFYCADGERKDDDNV